MKIYEFLDLLDDRKLVSRTVVARLREKAAQDPARLTPKAVLKYLVKKELIAHSAAQELLRTALTVSRAAESSILGNIPVPEPPPRPPASSLVTDDEDIPTLAPIDSRPNLRASELDDKLSESSSIFDDSPAAATPASGKLSSLAGKKREESAVEQLLAEEQAKVPPSPKKARAKSKSRRERGKSEWDSSLILYGGGGLLVLLLAGGIIYYLLNRENADFVLEQATDHFESGSYTQAIAQYEKFVESFPSHPQHSEAAVRLGTARLWQATSKTGDPEKALMIANAVLTAIEDEREFRSAQRDLAALLPKIADGLATQAEESTDAELVAKRVAQTREALSLCMNTKYVPKEFRDDVLLGEVEDTLVRVEYNQEQAVALAQALDEMTAALKAREIAKAYNVRDSLLDDYPALVNDGSLAEKVAEASKVAGEVVKFVEDSRRAEPGERPSPIVASLTLADRKALGEVNADGTVAVRIGGAVYGLKARDGSLVWRHFMGFDPITSPVPVENGDFLVVDSSHSELVRLEGATGKVVWRLPLDAETMQPVVVGNKAYLVQPAGRLLIVETESGTMTGKIEFGQELAVPPASDTSARRLYLLGKHSSLYTLSTDDNSCRGVYYLGHPAGSVRVPPVRVLNKLIVAVNTGTQSGRLKVLQLSREGSPTSVDVEQRLVGTVDTPLLAEGRRLVAITSLGEISVFDVANAEGNAALHAVAKRDADKGPSVARFSLVSDGNIWVADSQLNRLAVQATSKSIRVSNLDNDFAGDIFDHPLQVIGDVVVHVRRVSRGVGHVVAATNLSTGETGWQTELAVPLAGAPTVDAERAQISAMSANGRAYLLDRDALSRRIQDSAVRAPEATRRLPVFTNSVALPHGALAAGAVGSKVVVHFAPRTESSPVTTISLASELATDLMAWRDGFVAPTKVGQVFLLGTEEEEPAATPFQPPLRANHEYQWLAPATVGERAESGFVISDGNEAMYVVAFAAEPQPHLRSVAETELSGIVLNSRLAVAGEIVAGGSERGSLQRFKLPALEIQPAVELGGNVVWGPFAASSGFLLATDQDELLFVAESGEIAWRTSLDGKALTGIPLVDGENVFVAWQLHGVSQINVRDGALAATTSLEQALVAGPVAFASRLVLVASDGTLLVVNKP